MSNVASDGFRFPAVIGRFGVGGHELRLVAGETGAVRPRVSFGETADAVDD